MLVLLAAAFLPCVEPLPGGRHKEPPTLAALLDCQKRKLRRVKAKDHDWFEERQRAEVRDYVARHPDRATLQEPGEEAPPRPDPPAELSREIERADSVPADDVKTDTRSLERLIWKRAEEAPGERLSSEKSAAALRYIRDNNKGEVGAETVDLLEAMTRDGGRPSEETVRKMRKAALDAKGRGLQLGIDPEVEDDLLRGVERSTRGEAGRR